MSRGVCAKQRLSGQHSILDAEEARDSRISAERGSKSDFGVGPRRRARRESEELARKDAKRRVPPQWKRKSSSARGCVRSHPAQELMAALREESLRPEPTKVLGGACCCKEVEIDAVGADFYRRAVKRDAAS